MGWTTGRTITATQKESRRKGSVGDFDPDGLNIAGSGVSNGDGGDLETVTGVDGNTTTMSITISPGNIIPINADLLVIY